MAVDSEQHDLGALVHTERRVRRWRAVAVRAVVILAILAVATRDPVVLAAVAAGLTVAVALAAYVRFDVHEHGVVLRGWFVTRRFPWSRITGFSPMPRWNGRPGRTGAVVVDGRNHRIPTLREPQLYAKLRHLNATLLAHRPHDGGDARPSPAIDRRTGLPRTRATLWLGPGAAWWPPPDDRR